MSFLARAMQRNDSNINQVLIKVLQRVEELEKENALQKLRIIELEAQLKSNSKNSSRPPSSDGYRKQPALPKAKKGNQGGQKGHKGKTLCQKINPDTIIECKPDLCSCGYKFSEQESTTFTKRQVFELPKPTLEVTEYRLHKSICPECGLKNQGEVPLGVNAPVQYGNNAKAFAVLLNTHYKVPFKKIQLLFGDLFGYSINESTVYSAGLHCYNQLEQTEEVIKSQVSQADVAHADESGLRVLGELFWLHVATTLNHTYLFVHKNRGAEALKSDKSILNRIEGWLVHDCWSSYFKFTGMKHAICGAHILRELEGLIESENSKWAKTFKKFLFEVYLKPFDERIKQKEGIKARYLQICNIGEKLEPPPYKTIGKRGQYKRTKGRNLVERLIREEEAVLAFAFNKEVPFTNNLAERDIRPVKVKMKVSNCFRTLIGAEIYARIESFISTARKNDRNIFEELCNSLDGYNFLMPIEPS